MALSKCLIAMEHEHREEKDLSAYLTDEHGEIKIIPNFHEKGKSRPI
jgi:hypothetical protein